MCLWIALNCSLNTEILKYNKPFFPQQKWTYIKSFTVKYILLYTLGHKYGILKFSESKIHLRRLVCKNFKLECQKSLRKSHYFTSSCKSVWFKIFVRRLVLWVLKPKFLWKNANFVFRIESFKMIYFIQFHY